MPELDRITSQLEAKGVHIQDLQNRFDMAGVTTNDPDILAFFRACSRRPMAEVTIGAQFDRKAALLSIIEQVTGQQVDPREDIDDLSIQIQSLDFNLGIRVANDIDLRNEDVRKFGYQVRGLEQGRRAVKVVAYAEDIKLIPTEIGINLMTVIT